MTEPTTNGHANERWVSQALAAQVAGLSARELGRLGDKNVVQRKREAEGGDWLYYLPDAIAAALASKGTDALRAKGDTPEAQMAKAQNDLLAKTTLHLERTWALVHEPVLDIITELRLALKEANADNKALRAEMLKGDEQRRRLEDDAFTRQLARDQLERDQKRKDEAFEGAKRAATAVWPSVEDALKGLSVASKLRGTFDITKIQALLDVPGMLDAREAALLRELFGIPAPGAPAEAEAAEAGAEPETVETSGETVPAPPAEEPAE